MKKHDYADLFGWLMIGLVLPWQGKLVLALLFFIVSYYMEKSNQ